VGAIDIALTFDDAAVAVRENFGDEIEASGVARIWILVLPDHGDIGLGIVGDGGDDVDPDVVIRGQAGSWRLSAALSNASRLLVMRWWRRFGGVIITGTPPISSQCSSSGRDSSQVRNEGTE
jgi:hypothetical protein